jgi:flagellar hook-length control protein FliK
LPDSQSDDAIELATVPLDSTSELQPAGESIEIPSDWNLPALAKLLESMGDFEASGVSGSHNMAQSIQAEADPLGALKMLVAGFQQNHSAPTADLAAGPEHWIQIIATALEGQAGVASAGDSGQVLDPQQVTALKQFQHWLNDLVSGTQQAKISADLLAAPGVTDAKHTGAMSAESGSVDLSTENTRVSSQSNSQSSLEPKPSNAAPSPAPDINLASQTKMAADSQPAAPSNAKENPMPGFASETRTAPPPNPGQAQPIETAAGERPQSTTPGSQTTTAGSVRNPSVMGLSDTLIQSNAGEEPLSRVVREAQMVKEGLVKLDSGSIEETVAKVIKTETGSSDHNLLNSPGPNAEKLAEPAAKLKEAEAAQADFRNQTLNQIVRKAAIHLGNGLHEARIDLKPDFLGHIRMQVISDHHQVTVRILAEHGFVKDMIESNVHQLKVDLQQQGLEVDKLEVSVSRDPEDSGNSKDKMAQSKFRQGQANPNGDRDPGEEQPEKPRRSILTEEGSATVDYFA